MANEYDLLRCHTEDDRIPIQEFIDGIPDRKARARVRVCIDKMEDGNFGDVWPVGSGVSETRLHIGPGYRIYHARERRNVHLLNGGTKATQQADINFAIQLWSSHD